MKQSSDALIPPSDEQWRELYALAGDLEKQAPWVWIDDACVLGWQAEVETEPIFGTILGNGREQFGVNLWLGRTGWECYAAMHDLGGSPGDEVAHNDVMTGMNIVSIGFDPISFCQPEDRDIMHRVGFSPSKPSFCPIFRRYTPGRMPWFLSTGDADVLAAGIRRMMQVSEVARQHPALFPDDPFMEVLYLKNTSRKPSVSDYERGKPPVFPGEPAVEPPVLSVKRLKKFRKQELTIGDTVEAHVCRIAFPIAETQPSYYPWLIMVVNADTGLVLEHTMFGPRFNGDQVPEALLRACEEKRFLPRTVHVRDQLTMTMLKPICAELDISLKLRKHLSSLDGALRGIIQQYNDSMGPD